MSTSLKQCHQACIMIITHSNVLHHFWGFMTSDSRIRNHDFIYFSSWPPKFLLVALALMKISLGVYDIYKYWFSLCHQGCFVVALWNHNKTNIFLWNTMYPEGTSVDTGEGLRTDKKTNSPHTLCPDHMILGHEKQQTHCLLFSLFASLRQIWQMATLCRKSSGLGNKPNILIQIFTTFK